ncbi:hypothetical protein BSL78_18417 [Apostichopus japonicus]|uniref:BRICHOS domain-containing protein n=1 Tax=Stichopus japonicus TaxID=307972 RepID=A0A2G8K9V1_STIJA|nr:hypothetical protein BSL78_18417 [Apostichopus japonicus]
MTIKGIRVVKLGVGSKPEEGKDRTMLYVVAITVIVVTILVGFFGVFYLLLSAPEPTVINNLSNEVESETPAPISRSVSFDMGDGVEHWEKTTADGDMLTIQSLDENFIAIFDHGREITMFKNLTSSRCYFSHLDEIPDMGMNDMDNVHPFYFREIESGSDSMSDVDPSVEVFNFEQSDPIPTDYMKLTNSLAVSSLCSGGESYWLTPQNGGLVRRDVTVEIDLTVVGVHVNIKVQWG